MTKQLLVLSATLLALGVFSSPVQGQLLRKDRFSIEPRIGVAFPKGDFGDVDPGCPENATGCDFPIQTGAETGWGWEARLHYALTDHWSAVMGVGKTQLGCSQAFCGFGPEPETRALSLGLKARALAMGSMDVWVEIGGAIEKFSVIRTKNPQGEIQSQRVWYPWSMGYYLGAGTELALTGEGNFFFTPGFSFRFVPADPPEAHSDLNAVTALYLLAELGFKVVLR